MLRLNRPILHGMKLMLPMLASGLPFALLYGSLAYSYGLSLFLTSVMSIVVFAGAAQLAILPLIAQGAPLWTIVLTTFIVNLRHMLYSADLVKYVKELPLPIRLMMGFGLFDEVYAITRPLYASESYHKADVHRVYLGGFVSFYSMWNLGTIVGYIAAGQLEMTTQLGLEFAMVATFISIITVYLRRASHWLAMITTASASLALVQLPHSLGLFSAALLGMLVGYVAENLQDNWERHQ